MLPKPIVVTDPEAKVDPYGYGLNFKPHLKKGRDAGSKNPADYHFSPRTIGHGSITNCLLRVDLETGLVLVQIRGASGDNYGEWSEKFLMCISENLIK